MAAIAATSWKPWVSRLLLVHSGRITCGRDICLPRSTRHPAPCAPANHAQLDGRVYAWSASLGLNPRRCAVAGVEAAGEAAFVLVAGGLGERLGYSGIKLALPSDSARGACFLQVFCKVCM